MQISDAGLALIRSFEGYHRELKDGSGRCTAYQEEIDGKLDVATIGWGSVHGVKMGDVWTREQAEQALRDEVTEKTTDILKCVTVDLNQNELDALCSLAFNVGSGALRGSTLIKKLNAGDRAGAADEFRKWRMYQGAPNASLEARRLREAAVFRTPVEPVGASYMPQQVTIARDPLSARVKASIAGAAGTGATYVATNGLPPPPAMVSGAPAAADQWIATGKATLSTAFSLVGNATPLLVVAVVAVVLLVVIPKLAARHA